MDNQKGEKSMLHSLHAIEEVRNGNMYTKEANIWLGFLLEEYGVVSVERNYRSILEYVERTLRHLEKMNASYGIRARVETVLCWSEVSKCGSVTQRKKWKDLGVSFLAHNEDSAYIYRRYFPYDDVTFTLIRTHGLIGQVLRGEVSMTSHDELVRLWQRGVIQKDELREVLRILNECIITGVSDKLWIRVKEEVYERIEQILCGELIEYSVKQRIRRLRTNASPNDTYFVQEYDSIMNDRLEEMFTVLFDYDLWYVEAALTHFSFEEFVKVFALAYQHITQKNIDHISFQPLMDALYYEREGDKYLNIYTKRAIEKVLRSVSIVELLNMSRIPQSEMYPELKETENVLTIGFGTSEVGKTLIEFCLACKKENNAHYEQAVMMLCEIFGLRRDVFDRLENEEEYLSHMNGSVDDKVVVLPYVVGDTIVEIGPGGGVMMNKFKEVYPNKSVIGIDLSRNVIEKLTSDKYEKGYNWEVTLGDALHLADTFHPESISTVHCGSVNHEIFSYGETDGKKFNVATMERLVRSVFRVLTPGGRWIIRDGVKTESKEWCELHFHDETAMPFLKNYQRDFQGRQIKVNILDVDRVRMPVNDAMEFLYTYTWGEEAYPHEVQEQFGVFTLQEYIDFVESVVGSENVKVIEAKQYLLEGYIEHLSQKVTLYDEHGEQIALPNSTCLIVFEKR
ncbi:Methyltransferase type 12 [Bacillus pseudomycoides]|nr:Methyltransferase type 12 [Bacillus pseudomycoides]